MIDTGVIKEKYAAMGDSELLSFAANESHQLTEESLSLLQVELKRRKIEYSVNVENIPVAGANDNDPFIDSQVLHVFDELEHGKSNTEIRAALIENHLEENKVNELMQKAETMAMQKLKKWETEWLIGCLFFTGGVGVSLLPLPMPANKLTYILAWCAIIFGALKAIQSFYNKSRFKKIVRNLSNNTNIQ